MEAYAKPQQRNKEASERLRGEREIKSSLLILDLKMTGCKIRESKREARVSTNCMFLE